MIYETVFLRDFFEGIHTDATLTAYVRDNFQLIEPNRRRPSVIICPGGAYFNVCVREGEPVALEFMSRGYNAFVLDYSSGAKGNYHYPTQLLEISAAVAYVRRHADKYHAQKTAVLTCGFSAGGHLAASSGTLWNERTLQETLSIEQGENRPDGMILSYPVINDEPGSFSNLLGDDPDPALLEKCKLDHSVGPHTPPAFIWHTVTDAGVPVENSIDFATAMRKYHIPFELHLYGDGKHGLSLGTRETQRFEGEYRNEYITTWITLCDRWIKKFIDEEKADVL